MESIGQDSLIEIVSNADIGDVNVQIETFNLDPDLVYRKWLSRHFNSSIFDRHTPKEIFEWITEIHRGLIDSNICIQVKILESILRVQGTISYADLRRRSNTMECFLIPGRETVGTFLNTPECGWSLDNIDTLRSAHPRIIAYLTEVTSTQRLKRLATLFRNPCTYLTPMGLRTGEYSTVWYCIMMQNIYKLHTNSAALLITMDLVKYTNDIELNLELPRPLGPAGMMGPVGMTGVMGPVGMIGPVGMTGVMGPLSNVGISNTTGMMSIMGPMSTLGFASDD